MIDLPIALDWAQRPLRHIARVQGKPSMTRWQLARDADEAAADARTTAVFGPSLPSTRLLLEPVTGRSHQLRVHLVALGHAILGDALYATPAVQARSERLLLHASRLALVHPFTGVTMVFESNPQF